MRSSLSPCFGLCFCVFLSIEGHPSSRAHRVYCYPILPFILHMYQHAVAERCHEGASGVFGTRVHPHEASLSELFVQIILFILLIFLLCK